MTLRQSFAALLVLFTDLNGIDSLTHMLNGSAWTTKIDYVVMGVPTIHWGLSKVLCYR